MNNMSNNNKLMVFVFSWSVDKLELELKDRCWTFYVNPNGKKVGQSGSESSTDSAQELKETLDEATGQFSYINFNVK